MGKRGFGNKKGANTEKLFPGESGIYIIRDEDPDPVGFVDFLPSGLVLFYWILIQILPVTTSYFIIIFILNKM